MKDLCFKFSLSLVVTVAFFFLYRAGVYLDSLLTMRTELYFTLHWWAALILSPIVGASVFLKEW